MLYKVLSIERANLSVVQYKQLSIQRAKLSGVQYKVLSIERADFLPLCFAASLAAAAASSQGQTATIQSTAMYCYSEQYSNVLIQCRVQQCNATVKSTAMYCYSAAYINVLQQCRV